MTWSEGLRVVGVIVGSFEDWFELLRVLDPNYFCSLQDRQTEPELFRAAKETLHKVDPAASACLRLYLNTASSTLYVVLQHAPDVVFIATAAAAARRAASPATPPHALWNNIEAYHDAALRSGLLMFLISHVVLLVNCTAVLDTSVLYKMRVMQTAKQAAMPSLPSLLARAPVKSGGGGKGKGGAGTQQEIRETPGLYSPALAVILLLEAEGTGCDSGQVSTQQETSVAAGPNPSLLESQVHSLVKRCKIATQDSAGPALFSLDANRSCYVLPARTDGSSTAPSSYAAQQLLSLRAFMSQRFDVHTQGSSSSRKEPPSCVTLESWCAALNILACGMASAYSVAAAADAPTSPSGALGLTHGSHRICEDMCGGVDEGLLSSMSWCVSCGWGVSRHSGTKCNRALAVARDAYNQAVPELYCESVHASVLHAALGVYWSVARGPMAAQAAQQLQQECEENWRQGHQQCDAVSLSGHRCILHPHPLTNSDAPVAVGEVTAQPHVSGMEYYMSTAEGQEQHWVDDPFDFEAANGAPGLALQRSGDASSLMATCTHVAAGGTTDGKQVSVGRWFHVTRLGHRDSYSPQDGLTYPGFEKGSSFLHPLTLQLATMDEPDKLDAVEFPPLAPTAAAPAAPTAGAALHTQQAAAVAQREKLLRNWPMPGQPVVHSTQQAVPVATTNDKPRVLEVPRRGTKEGKAGTRKASKQGAKGGGVREERAGGRKLSVTAVQSVKIYVGYEYESRSGTRFLLSPKHIAGKEKDAKLSAAAARFLLAADLPLFIEMAAETPDSTARAGKDGKKGSGKGGGGQELQLLQLRRLWVVTAESPLQLASQPKIRFQWPVPGSGGQEGGGVGLQAVEFAPEGTVVLPPSSLVVVTLPWAYGMPQAIKEGMSREGTSTSEVSSQRHLHPLIQVDATQPYHAFVMAGTTFFPA